MPAQLHERVVRYLSNGNTGVLSARAPNGVLSLPVRYRADGMELECLVPRWSDITYLLEEHPIATIVVTLERPGGLSWLHYQGRAVPNAATGWGELAPTLPTTARPGDLFVSLRLRPVRIELVRDGWTRQTLDFT